MKSLNWVELTRQQIKARHGSGWSIQGIEKQNKVLTKIVYRFSTGRRTTVLTDIEWNTNNSKKIQDLIIEFETLMEERHVDLKKAYELILEILSDFYQQGQKEVRRADIVTTAFNIASAARQTVDNTLGNMVNNKQIRRTKKGVYALNPKDIQRLI